MTPWQLLWEWLVKHFPIYIVAAGLITWTLITFYGAYRFAKWRYHKRIETHLPELAKAHIGKLHSENRSLRAWMKKQRAVNEDLVGAMNGIQRLSSGNWSVVKEVESE